MTLAVAPLPTIRLVGVTEAFDTARSTFGAVNVIGTAYVLLVVLDSLTLSPTSVTTSRYWLPRNVVFGIVKLVDDV